MGKKFSRSAKADLFSSAKLAAFAAIILFTISGVLFALKTPAWLPYDEPFHFLYAEKIASDGKLPSREKNYEAAHPPLYYALAALSLLPAKKLPYDKQLIIARLLSVILGAGALIAVFSIGRTILADEWQAAACVAFVASTPMFNILFSSVTNDALSILLATASTAHTVSGAKEKNIWRRPVIAGLLCALAILSKITCVFLAPLFLLSLLFPRDGQPFRFRRAAAQAIIFTLVVAAVTSPWFLYGYMHFGGNMFRNVVSDPQPYNILWPPSNILKWARMLFGSFWYYKEFLRNPDALALPLWVYEIFLGISAVAIAGLGRRFLRPAGSETSAGSRNIIFLSFAIFCGLAQMYLFNLATYNASARYLYPMIGPIAVLSFIGFRQLLGRFAVSFTFAFAALIFAFNMVMIFSTVSALPHVPFKIGAWML